MAEAAGLRGRICAVLLVGATYIYFLLFAQFGFLQGVRTAGLDATAVQLVLGVMAVGGVTASLLTPLGIARLGHSTTLITGLLIAAASAAGVGTSLASDQGSPVFFVLAAAGIGVGVGFTTVALAADLRRLTQARHTGAIVGSGTGLAYFVCNIPALYGGTPGLKAWAVAVMALLGILFAIVAPGRECRTMEDSAARVPEGWRSGRGLVAVVCAFATLVWFDSAAFAALQLSPETHAHVWGTDAARWINGAAHALAAVLGGVWLDRGGLRSVLALALLLLVGGAFAFREAELWNRVAGPTYAAGVSLYSAALAAFAALDGRNDRMNTPAWRAAWLYAGAGWIGSAAGVGFVEELRWLPGWAAPLAAVMFVAAIAQSRITRKCP